MPNVKSVRPSSFAIRHLPFQASFSAACQEAMIADPPTDLPTVRILDDVAEWDDLASDWGALFDASPEAATPLQFVWLRLLWRLYGPIYGANGASRALRLFTFWRGSRVVGALPLYENRVGGYFFGLRRIAFLSTGEAGDA